jgi:uncharacterized membrane protein YgcG
MTTKTKILLGVASFVGVVATAGGCASQEQIAKAMQMGQFEPDDSPRAIHRFADAQAANGATDDGMLYPMHFDGPELNSLGRQKLDLILTAHAGGYTTDGKLKVYLAPGAEQAAADARKKSVEGYLTGHGVAADELAVAVGINPNAVNPAAPNQQRQKKTETGGGGSGGGTGGTVGGSSSGTAGGGGNS